MERVRLLNSRFAHSIITFCEMIKIEHSIFALPFAYLGLILAEGGLPRPHLFFWVTVAMVSFRSFGMSLNRLIDRSIDKLNPRTENRALPAGKIKTSTVWLITAVCFLIYEISAYLLGPVCFSLSLIPVFLAWLYPWTKRFTWLSHFVLGIILGIAPYGAWLASRGEFSWIPGFLMLGIATWVAGFDMIYALLDVEFDRRQGLYSFPARFGQSLSMKVTQGLHFVTITAWVFMGIEAGLGMVYFSGLLLVSFFLVREHWLIKSFGLAKLEEAFFSMNAVVSIAIFLVTIADIWIRSLML
ncbi:MAG: UbiA family prenyltransferase [Candidatus Omnitrophica bacterium]|nr:UbiA family prenyltransferase [Candidatus Omnitrophota bacterium]